MSKKLRVAINGFGRIGRAFLKVALTRADMDVIAVNDLGDIHNLAYLLQYDTVYKVSPFDVHAEVVSDSEQYLVITYGEVEKKIRVTQVKEPEHLPWAELDIDVVVESTGLFTAYDKAYLHVQAGAKKVVISAPAKEGDTEVPG